MGTWLHRKPTPSRHVQPTRIQPSSRSSHSSCSLNPSRLSKVLRAYDNLDSRYRHLAPDAVVACDVGQHQMWVAQHCRFSHPRNHLTSGALGTMGFGLPAAMGAQFACPERPVVLVSGDGSFMMNVQELVTVARCKLPVKMILLDNSSLGMVRQWQELFYQNNIVATPLKNPDFVKLAEAFHIKGLRAEKKEQVAGVIHEAMQHPGPVVIDFQVRYGENCYPMVPPGASLDETIDAPAPQEVTA